MCLTNVRLTLNPRDIQKNISTIRSHLGAHTDIIWIVKSRGYGVGLPLLSKAFSDVKWLGVESPTAAAELCQIALHNRVLVIYPYSPEDFSSELRSEVIKGNLVPTVDDLESLRAWARVGNAAPWPIKLHLKIGLPGGRFGAPSHLLREIAAIAESSSLEVEAVFAHTSFGLVKDPEILSRQLKFFCVQARNFFPNIPVHFSDSACIQRGIGTELDFVRAGLLPLGICPVSENQSGWRNLRVPFRLLARVVRIRTLNAGDSIGYQPQANRNPRRVAIVGCGYGHGLPRKVANGGFASWNRLRLAYACAPWMEYSALEIPLEEGPVVGDEIEMVGPTASPQALANLTGCIPEEFCVNLAPSIKRMLTS